MPKPILFLMLGYPGAGKTTTAEIIAKLTGAMRLTSDQERLKMFPRPTFTPEEHAALYKALDAETEEALAAGKGVIYDANLNRFRHRQEKYDICQRTGAEPVLIWLRTPAEIAKQRSTELAGDDKARRPFGNLDKQVFDRLVQEIEPPRRSEKPFELDGTHINQQSVRNLLEQAGVL